jgi:hypothetical protein
MDPRIADYIRANRARYTRDAIRRQLLAAGHDPAEIDRTWAILDTPDADDVAGEGFWRRFAVILIGVNIGIFLVIGLLTGMLSNVGASAVLLVIFAVVLAIGALIAWGVVALTGPAKMSPTTATVIGSAIPLFFALLVGGSCYALAGAIGPPPPPARSGRMQVQLGEPLNVDRTVEAQCQPSRDAALGFSVYANLPGAEGRALDISVNVYPQAPGADPQPMLFISEAPGSDIDAPVAWSNEFVPGAAGGLDVALEGLNGTIRFTDLPAAPMEGPEAPTASPEPLSGELTWTCE